MQLEDLAQQILATWDRHQEVLLFLLEKVPEDGLAAKPTGSRGRDVARQFAHLHRVRLGWVHHHETGKRPKLPRVDKGPPPPREEIRQWLEQSGLAVREWLERAVRGEAAPRMFGKMTVRWLGYLIAHESHHRGQILLALKQNGMRLPEEIAVQGVWGKWIFGK